MCASKREAAAGSRGWWLQKPCSPPDSSRERKGLSNLSFFISCSARLCDSLPVWKGSGLCSPLDSSFTIGWGWRLGFHAWDFPFLLALVPAKQCRRLCVCPSGTLKEADNNVCVLHTPTLQCTNLTVGKEMLT